jgi:hypothetical protein
VACERPLRAARRNHEPVACRLRGRHALRGQQDQSIVVEIDGIAIMIGCGLVGRRSGYRLCDRLSVMVVAVSTVTGIPMAAFMPMVVAMARQVNMLPMGMPRSFGMGLVRMRHRNSAEKQLGGHEHDEEQSHDSSSLVWTCEGGKLERHDPTHEPWLA